MAEKTTSGLDTQLARQTAFLRFFCLPLLIAVVAFGMFTRQTILASFSMRAGDTACLAAAHQDPAQSDPTPEEIETSQATATRPLASIERPDEPLSCESENHRELSDLISSYQEELARTCSQFAQESTETWQGLSTRIATELASRREAIRELAESVHDDTHEEAASSAPPASAVAVETPSPVSLPHALVLVNPAETNGTVTYLLDGGLYSLQPGQQHELPPNDAWEIQFHRGGDFGNARHDLAEGTYVFRVTEQGWQLSGTGDVPLDSGQ